MTCCAPGIEASAETAGQPELDDETLMAVSAGLGDGLYQLELAVPDVHCGACIAAIEGALSKLDMVEAARVNLSARRVRIKFQPARGRASALVRAIHAKGYRAFVLDPDADTKNDAVLAGLVRALAVAGFAAGNIMLFSVSVWSGADDTTRDLFHWISAAIAIPAVAYAGQPFFRSALNAVRHGALNMDVPIALAVLLALVMSLFETLNGGEHAYFDAAVSLLFFLLIGRTLDYLMREKARGAVRNLARLAPRHALRVLDNGSRERIGIAELEPGMRIEVLPGERVPVDGVIIEGVTELDLSLVNGESVPEKAEAGRDLMAGTLNLTGTIVLKVKKPAADSFLSRMIGMVTAAEGSRAGYRRIADRAAAIYAPAVHLLALGTFIGWGMISGDWHQATINAIAVLIVTCPCALALAVPIVHVVASGRLFEQGIMMRDGAALERLAQVDHVAFDKTGTLTLGRPVLTRQILGAPDMLARAARLARASNHPFSRALVHAAGDDDMPALSVSEIPGQGLEARDGSDVWRLGRAGFCNAEISTVDSGDSSVWLSLNGVPVAGFAFADQIRPETVRVLAELRRRGLPLSLLSGDRVAVAAGLARLTGIDDVHAELTPQDKLDLLNRLVNEGRRVLMVGDGINDAPALRAAHVSMAPSSAADIGRSAADFVYTHNSLEAVPFALKLARRAASAVRQNFGLAIAYNCIAVPLAVTGHVTPLIAALAMSSSSIVVTLNALRLRLGPVMDTPRPEQAGLAAPSHRVPAE